MAEIGDAFPRRDLGGSAENWGRHLEQRIVKLESLFGQLDSMQGNLNRQSTGAASNISSQIGSLEQLLANQTDIINAIPIPVRDGVSRSAVRLYDGYRYRVDNVRLVCQ